MSRDDNDDDDLDTTPTRDVRRTVWLASGIYEAFEELVRATGPLAREKTDGVLRTLHRHLSAAWDHGALREADLRQGLAGERELRRKLQLENERLRHQLHDALRRLSEMR